MKLSNDSATDNEETIEIKLLNESDLASAMQLKELARWNQTQGDWRRLLEIDPCGCFAACLDGRIIGTVTTATFGIELSWIGMMLVHHDYRRRGIGKRLMQAALDYLLQAGVATIKLDATSAGRPLYESLGFIPEAVIERWEGIAQPFPTSGLSVFDEQMRQAVHNLDRLAFGADRAKLLDSLIADSCIAPLIATGPGGLLRGYALARRGSEAFYAGPITATDRRTAIALFDGVLSQLPNEKVYIDFHIKSGVNSNALSERRFVKQRDLTRMWYGKQNSAGTSNLIFAIAGPEIG